MSEVQKPVEETPASVPAATEPVEAVAATEAAPAADEAKPAETPAVESAGETAAPTEDATAEPKTEEAAKEEAKVEPIYEGVLDYKGPGLLKIRFSKRYFWFGDEAVESKSLSAYLREEKPEVAHANAAWAGETGKGLLFYVKRVEDKSAPTGIINLSEVIDISKEMSHEFSFKVGKDKHTFKVANKDEQASWIAAVKEKVEEAKGSVETVKGSDGYKATLEKLSKPTIVPVPAAKPAETEAPKDAAPATEEAKEEVPKKEEPKKTKSRSQSRKRVSIFGTLRGKKEEHDEKKEVKKEDKVEETEEDKKEETTEEATPAEPVAEASAAATEATETDKPVEAEAESPKAVEAPPKPTKRSSVIGDFWKKFSSPTHEKSEKEVVPTVPDKDETPPVAETAPQLDNPVEDATPKPEEPATEAAAEEAKPAEAETATPKEAEKKEKKEGGLFSFIKKHESKHEEKKDAKTEEESAKTEESAATAESPAAESAVATETPAETAAAAPAITPKERRRTSLFGNLGGKKEKKEKAPAEPLSEGEVTDGEPKKASSPVNKLESKIGSIFRKPSKPAKSEAPAVPAKEEPVKEEAAAAEPAQAETAAPAETTEQAQIGDVVADAVSTGQPSNPAVQAAA
ncbi:MAG: hypothetical protein M1834_008138 [Cirrosporium novae-zelandiae]|nr:MAG: hypothetical protein M1834_008138 [Cirrosporium novae-zelandiae]